MNRDLALWIVILAGPVLWLCAFEANFALAPWACTFQNKLALESVWIAGVLLCCGSALWAWALWRSIGGGWGAHEAGVVSRSRMMAIAGIVLSASFALVMVAQAIPVFMLGACE
jgi:hypothetical protein